MKVRVIFDLNIGEGEAHPNYAAYIVDTALVSHQRSHPHTALLSWGCVDAQEVQHEVR